MKIDWLPLNTQARLWKRQKLNEVLNLCTEREIDLFNKMYKSIEAITEDKINTAYDQIMRTLTKQRDLRSLEQKEGKELCQ